MRRVILMVATAALVACSAKSTTAPATVNVTGNWSGSLSDASAGIGALSMSLLQASNDSVSGTWATTFPDTAHNQIGNVVGIVSAATATLILRPADPPTCQYGPFQFTGAVSGAALMSGKFASAYACVTLDSGTFSVTRQ